MPDIVDSYSESNYTGDADLNSQDQFGVGQSFTGNGEIVDSVKFYLYKGGSPTGNAVAKIYAHTGTFGTSSKPTGAALATSDNFNVATLTGSIGLKTFIFSGSNAITLTNGTKYVVTLEYSGGDLNNTVFPGTDDTSPTHAGNFSSTLNGSTWSADSGLDLIFYVYGIAASCVVDQQQTNNSSNDFEQFGSLTQKKLAQTFKPSVTAKICNFKVEIYAENPPYSDNIQLEIYSDNSGTPGSLLGTADNQVAGSSLTSDPTFVDFTFTNGPQLSGNTTYWAILSRTGSLDNSHYYFVYGFGDTPDSYTRGKTFVQLSDDSWFTFDDPGYFEDIYFKEYYDNTTIGTTTSTSTTSSSSTSSTSSSTSSSSTSSTSSSTSSTSSSTSSTSSSTSSTSSSTSTSSTSSSSSTSSTSSSSSTSSTSSSTSSTSSSTSSTSSSTSSTSSSTSSTSSSSSTSSTSSSSSTSTSHTTSSSSTSTSSTSSSSSSTSSTSSSSSTSSTSSSSSSSTSTTLPPTRHPHIEVIQHTIMIDYSR